MTNISCSGTGWMYPSKNWTTFVNSENPAKPKVYPISFKFSLPEQATGHMCLHSCSSMFMYFYTLEALTYISILYILKWWRFLHSFQLKYRLNIRGQMRSHCETFSNPPAEALMRGRVSDTDTYPPIIVLLSQDHQHLALRKAQLVMVVGLAVIQRLNPTTGCSSRLIDTYQIMCNIIAHVSQCSSYNFIVLLIVSIVQIWYWFTSFISFYAHSLYLLLA